MTVNSGCGLTAFKVRDVDQWEVSPPLPASPAWSSAPRCQPAGQRGAPPADQRRLAASWPRSEEFLSPENLKISNKEVKQCQLFKKRIRKGRGFVLVQYRYQNSKFAFYDLLASGLSLVRITMYRYLLKIIWYFTLSFISHGPTYHEIFLTACLLNS
jgi:hypothetical protein